MKIKTAVIIVAIAAVVLGVLMYRYYAIPRTVSNQFNGEVIAVDAQKNYFEAKGFFVVPDAVHTEQLTQDKKVRIYISKETKIIKTLLYLPSSKDLVKTSGMYKPSDLKRETVDAGIGDLKDIIRSSARVLITAAKDIYNRSSFAAAKIEYIEPVYPK